MDETLTLKITENGASGINQVFEAQIEKYGNTLTDQCAIDVKTSLEDSYAHVKLDIQQLKTLLTASGTQFDAVKINLVIYDEAKFSQKENQMLNLSSINQHLIFDFEKDIKIEDTTYYSVVHLETSYLNAHTGDLFYEPVASTSCFEKIIFEAHPTQMCLKILPLNSSSCFISETGTVNVVNGDEIEQNVQFQIQINQYEYKSFCKDYSGITLKNKSIQYVTADMFTIIDQIADYQYEGALKYFYVAGSVILVAVVSAIVYLWWKQ
ncbi:Hypothetical_protein [Hexamita inflata]|uniref:Hypothetical_protein n=1 Tax=Hexamita inflata TaxID=28002 RepID=A0AA86UVJ6_9EUKA|nr:Hypothetical protein HINF_LOCUS57209 [Hexamita inflata]CAI9969569.1 Hypothetical protein HINF_LOCUS57214 [Hexamita inflata]